jgi:diguanylate cyclase (GGDEF)-like protein/PAS domain S-box-containing protein
MKRIVTLNHTISTEVSQWHSLKTRATVFTLAIFVLGIWSLSFYVSRSLQTDMERLLGEQQFSAVATVAKEVNTNLAERMQALQAIAKEMDSGLMARPTAMQARLEQRPLLQMLFNGGVWVAGLDGTAIADVPLSAQRIGINYMDMDFIEAALKEGKSAIGRPVMGRQLKAPIFAMTVPLHNAQGKVMGALVGVTNLGKPNFLDTLTHGTYGKTGGYFLNAPQYRLVVTASDPTRIMQPFPPPGINKMLDRYMQGYEGYGITVNSKGVEQLIAAKGVPVAGWFLATVMPTAEAFAPLHDLLHRLLWATALLTLLSGALIWWVMKRQLAPLVETANALSKLADSGQLPTPLAITPPGEIGQVVTGFNRILRTWRQREAALQQRQIMLERTESMAHLASFEWDVDTNTVTWSPEMFRIFGRDPALGIPNLEGQAELYTPESMPILFDAVDKAVSDGMPYEVELMTVQPDGEQRPCIAKGFPERNASGRVVRVAGLVQDITARKQAEAALIASEERWKFAIDGAGDGLWDWNIQTGKAFYSSRYKTMLGFTEDEVGDTADEWRKRIHPEDAPGVYAALQPYMDGKPGNATVEFRMLSKDGSWMWALGRGMVVQRDANGKATRMIGTNSDITERKLAEKDRREQHALFQDILATALDGYWLADTQGRLLDVNDAACAMLGYTKQDALCLHVSDIDVEDSQEAIDSRIRRMQLHGGDLFESRHRRKDGSIIYVEVSIRYLSQKSAFSVFVRDITQRKQSEAKVQLAASVFGHAREGIFITNAQGTIIDVNEAFTRITGYSREDAIGQNPRILKSGRQDMAFYETMWVALTEQGHWSGEVWNRRKNGEVYAELLTISAVRDGQGNTQQYVALFSDISTIKTHQSQLEHIAHFDLLTNLPNRLLLADRLQQAMTQAQRRGQQVAVVFLDLDGFKGVNDRHGHDVGDQLLISLATAMKDSLREGDTLARMGGDEFVAVLIDLENPTSCVPMLTRLLGAAAAPVQLGSLVLQGSASIGVTFYPQNQDIDADQLLRQADQAMYQAKVAGKNRYHIFDAVQDSSMRVHHETLERIHLGHLRREFVLHYQPKVNMQSGEVVGAEALIRWQHPDSGLLAPAAFLPVIEDHPLAVDVGEWVIDTALHQMEIWHAAGLDLPVSVNISARQLQLADFMERLQAILAKHPQVNPTSLELEVLETSALADLAQVSQVIEECATIGVKFALDDFGTGYLSLTHLKRLRVALLKIDQSFVRDMLDDPEDMAILEGVIGLAAAFKRDVIAEGVETVELGSALLHLGCQLAQGYGIARPMPPEQMPAWVATWRPNTAWCAVQNFPEA